MHDEWGRSCFSIEILSFHAYVVHWGPANCRWYPPLIGQRLFYKTGKHADFSLKAFSIEVIALCWTKGIHLQRFIYCSFIVAPHFLSQFVSQSFIFHLYVWLCFSQRCEDNCYPQQHGRNNGWANMNEECWLCTSQRSAIKHNRFQQETELHSVQFPANRREKLISLFRSTLIWQSAIKYIIIHCSLFVISTTYRRLNVAPYFYIALSVCAEGHTDSIPLIHNIVSATLIIYPPECIKKTIRVSEKLLKLKKKLKKKTLGFHCRSVGIYSVLRDMQKQLSIYFGYS